MNLSPRSSGEGAPEGLSPTEWQLKRHVRGVWRFLQALGASEIEADDLTQEACVVAWRKRAFELDHAALGAFLRRTARFKFLNLRKAQGIEARRIADAVEGLWEERCADDDGDGLVAAVRHCRDELQGRARSIVELTYDQGKSRRDAAAALGMTQDGVKSLLQRTREVLRNCVRRRQAWTDDK